MRNSRMKIVGVLAASALALTGCGEAVYIMTPEEEAAVVSYASRTLSKYNNYQKDGAVYVPIEVLDGGEDGTEQPAGDALVSEDGVAPEGGQAADTGGGTATGGAAGGEQAVTLNQALDLGPVLAECVSTEFLKSYVESDLYALDAEPGKQFLVLHINLTNQSEQALHVNILSMTPTFVVHINDSLKVPVQTTILLNDLGTFQGDIAAGGVAETVLLFQVPEDVTEVTSMQLNVTMDGNSFSVNL